MLLVAPAFYLLLETFLDSIPPSVLHHWVNALTAWRRFMSKRGLFGRMTMAQMLLCLPLLYLGIKAMILAFSAPTLHNSLKHSGKLTSYAIVCAFLTASKSHSVISLITGLSFDRLINFHRASALLTLWMACLHCLQIAYRNRGDNKTHDHDHDHDHNHADHDEDEVTTQHPKERDPSHYHPTNGEIGAMDQNTSHEDENHDGHYLYHRILHTDSIHAALGPDPNLWKFFWDGTRNQSGFIVLTSLVVLISTSLFAKTLRQWYFEGWLASHITGIVLVLIFGLIHGADIFIFALIWWVLDWIIRYGFLASVRYPKQAQITRICDSVTQITFPKSQEFQYQPGQFVRVAIPTVEPLQFHPFSLASAPEDDKVTLYVRALPQVDAWTRQLHDIVTPSQDGEKISMLNVRILVEGPYGSIPTVISKNHEYSMAVMICGGIGVTPCHSVAKALVSNPPAKLQKIWFIWSVRDEAMVQAIPPPTRAHSSASTDKTMQDDNENGIEMTKRDAGQLSQDDEEEDHSDALADTATKQPLELQTDIFVTQLSSKIQECEEHSVDSPSFQYNVHRGRRLDVSAIVRQIQTEAEREGWPRVFVMGSGPTGMLDDLQEACRMSQLQNLQIDYEQEVFGY